jgi:hypothetical protein
MINTEPISIAEDLESMSDYDRMMQNLSPAPFFAAHSLAVLDVFYSQPSDYDKTLFAKKYPFVEEEDLYARRLISEQGLNFEARGQVLRSGTILWNAANRLDLDDILTAREDIDHTFTYDLAQESLRLIKEIPMPLLVDLIAKYKLYRSEDSEKPVNLEKDDKDIEIFIGKILGELTDKQRHFDYQSEMYEQLEVAGGIEPFERPKTFF